MPKGEKQIPEITRGKVLELAKEAKESFLLEMQIESFRDLEPIMTEFDKAGKQCRHCFDFLVQKKVLNEGHKKSFSNAFSMFRKRRNR